MDETDRKLLILMSANPRIHFQELAKRLGVSRQAVHHRMEALTKTGVIRGATAGISFAYLDAVPASVFGRSRTASIEKTLDRLGENELTRRAVVAGGNYIYVLGELRKISELDSFAEFVKRVAEIPEPTVAIACFDDELSPDYFVDGVKERKSSYKGLSPLDLRIIASLRDDARRSIAEVADMVGASAKTVKRHLEGMTSEGSLELHIPMDMPSGGPILLVMHVNLREGADKAKVGRRLLSKYSLRDAYVRTYINIPCFLMLVFWSQDVPEIRQVLEGVGQDEDVSDVMLNFCYLERLYPTWRDKLLEVPKRSSKTGRARSLPSGPVKG